MLQDQGTIVSCLHKLLHEEGIIDQSLACWQPEKVSVWIGTTVLDMYQANIRRHQTKGRRQNGALLVKRRPGQQPGRIADKLEIRRIQCFYQTRRPLSGVDNSHHVWLQPDSDAIIGGISDERAHGLDEYRERLLGAIGRVPLPLVAGMIGTGLGAEHRRSDIRAEAHQAAKARMNGPALFEIGMSKIVVAANSRDFHAFDGKSRLDAAADL